MWRHYCKFRKLYYFLCISYEQSVNKFHMTYTLALDFWRHWHLRWTHSAIWYSLLLLLLGIISSAGCCRLPAGIKLVGAAAEAWPYEQRTRRRDGRPHRPTTTTSGKPVRRRAGGRSPSWASEWRRLASERCCVTTACACVSVCLCSQVAPTSSFYRHATAAAAAATSVQPTDDGQSTDVRRLRRSSFSSARSVQLASFILFYLLSFICVLQRF